VALVTLVACRDHKAPDVRKSPLETAIARDLTARLATPVTATCEVIAVVAKCEAVLADGTKLPIEVKSEGTEWAWRVSGLVLETLPIATHINAVLADMKLAQQASCGPRIVFVAPGDRIGCKLSGGGLAFVEVAPDGTTSLELDIDATSGAARGELVTPERDRELTEISRALEQLEGESDGEEEVPGDGGVLGDAGAGSDGGAAKP
jgi:hypothetical protein